MQLQPDAAFWDVVNVLPNWFTSGGNNLRETPSDMNEVFPFQLVPDKAFSRVVGVMRNDRSDGNRGNVKVSPKPSRPQNKKPSLYSRVHDLVKWVRGKFSGSSASGQRGNNGRMRSRKM